MHRTEASNFEVEHDVYDYNSQIDVVSKRRKNSSLLSQTNKTADVTNITIKCVEKPWLEFKKKIKVKLKPKVKVRLEKLNVRDFFNLKQADVV
jgi:hypothetical protein